MAASAGSMKLVGGGRTLVIDVYQPDAVSTLLTFNPSGLAASTSPSTFRVPFDCVITDFSIVTGATAVGGIVQINNSSINGGAVRWANHLNTLANRTQLAIPVNKGDFISVLQF